MEENPKSAEDEAPKGEGEQQQAQEDDGRPVKRIKIPVEIESKFLKSQAFFYVNTFILALNEAMKRRKLSEPCEPMNPVIVRAVNVVERIRGWIKEFPLVAEVSLSRFGNVAFRGWFDRVGSESESLMKEIVGSECEDWQIVELSTYFKESFGNRTRIDYGTGHELCFVAWMCCLARLNLIKRNDEFALVARLFNAYLGMMRHIQTYYKLEPAGSHGVWGLDDHQFLPFLWGAAQLIDHPELLPKHIHQRAIVDQYAPDYLYFAGIQFILNVKKGPFHEHSPLLNDISTVHTWAKVNSGLIKMYMDEVFKKHVVIQHFLFGKLLSFELMPPMPKQQQ